MRQPLSWSLGRVRSFLAAAILLALAVDCAATPRPLDLPKAGREYLVGTWVGKGDDVVFLPDGTYCTFGAGSLAPSSIGTWAASEVGFVTVSAGYAEDSYRVTPDDDAVTRSLRPGRWPAGSGRRLAGVRR